MLRCHHVEDVGEERTVAIREAALELIGELQVGTLEDGFGVRKTCAPVPVLRRAGVLLIVERQVLSFLEIMDQALAVARILALADTTTKVETDVAARFGQTTVNLHPAIDIVAAVVAEVVASIGIDEGVAIDVVA